MKLRTIGMAAVAALALVAGRAQAEDGGWNTKYGMLFQAQNIFTQPGFLNGYGAGVGVQYNLEPTKALRITANLARQSDPVTDVDTTVGTTTQTSLNVPGALNDLNNPPFGVTSKLDDFYAPTSAYKAEIGGAYLIRVGTAALAPYFGAGAKIGYTALTSDWDGVVPNQLIYTTKDTYRAYELDASGLLGLEWRVHKSVSLFAEYGLNVALYQKVSEKTDHTTQPANNLGAPVAGSTATTVKQDTSYSKFINFDTGLNQGGQLGVVAYF